MALLLQIQTAALLLTNWTTIIVLVCSLTFLKGGGRGRESSLGFDGGLKRKWKNISFISSILPYLPIPSTSSIHIACIYAPFSRSLRTRSLKESKCRDSLGFKSHTMNMMQFKTFECRRRAAKCSPSTHSSLLPPPLLLLLLLLFLSCLLLSHMPPTPSFSSSYRTIFCLPTPSLH